MEWMYSYMVGIRSLGFAFEQVMFTPKPDMRADREIPAGQERITWAKGSYESKYGTIKSEWRREGNGFVFVCETPVSGEFQLPIIEGKNTVTVNGNQLAVDSLEVIDGCAIIKLERGKYTIEY
jgi:alpha-L-rhamnosidase